MKKRNKSIISLLFAFCLLLSLVLSTAVEGLAISETSVGIEHLNEADLFNDSDLVEQIYYESWVDIESEENSLYYQELSNQFYLDDTINRYIEDTVVIERLREENPFFYLEPCEQAYFEATIYDDFEDDAVIIVLDRDISRISSEQNRVFTADDFRDVGALYVEDIMYLSARCNVYAQQLWDAEQQLVLSKGIVTEEELHEIRDELLEVYEEAGSHAVRSFIAESRNQEVLQAYLEALEEAEENTMWNFDQFRRILLIRLDQNCRENVLHAVYLLQQREYINSAEPKLIHACESSIYPNDHYFRQTNATYQWAVRRLSLPQAWGLISNLGDTPAVRVGIIGHGIDENHPELRNRVTAAPCGSLEEVQSCGCPHGHGTQQSGIIGAMGNNNIGIAGISWNAQVVSLGVRNHYSGVNAAAQMGIPIITRSFDGQFTVTSALYRAVQSYGGLFINSAGNTPSGGINTNNNPRFPGLNNVLIVGSSDRNDNRANVSNFGSASVHLFAPGASIRTTLPTTHHSHPFGVYNNTSAAAPHVAGVAALVLRVNPMLSTQQLRDIILSSVCPIPAFADISISGGRLNAYRAVSYAKRNTWVGLQSTINAAPTGVPVTIQLSTDITAPIGTNGNAIVIPANRNITLVSDGTAARTLTQTNANQRHFVISQGASLTLGNGVTLSGGTANNTNDSGGILVNAGGALTMLAGSIIENSHRTIAGGAVQLQGTGTAVGTRATFNMRGGTIRNNTGTQTGGIDVAVNSTFTMSGGTISGNTANAATLSGGGVRLTAATSTFTMTNGTISGNMQTNNANHWGAGGVAIVGNGTFTMSGGNITGNSSVFSWGAGAVSMTTGTFTMSGTARISGNTATGTSGAGGVHVDGSNAQFIINGGTIGGSRAADANEGRSVGGVRLSRGRTTMNGGLIQGNTNGGVRVHESSTTIVTEFTMDGGTIDGNVSTGTIGAGVHLISGRFVMARGTIRNNHQNGGTTANSGGGGVRVNDGVFWMNGGSARIENNTASGTATTAGGGGIHHQGGSAHIVIGVITNNHANNQGGGVFTNNPGRLTLGLGAMITNNTPDNIKQLVSAVNTWTGLQSTVNSALANVPITIRLSASFTAPTGTDGNAIVIPANRNITLESSSTVVRTLTQTNAIQRHFVVSQGASLTLGNRITLSGGAANNTNNSGGILVDAGGSLTMLAGSIVENNHKTHGGVGAVQLRGTGTDVDTRATFNMNGGTIRNNTCVSAGGVSVGSNSAFTMSGGTISENIVNAAAVSGGGVRLTGGTFTMTGGTISGNNQTNNVNQQGAGGVAISSGTFTMSGGNITGNSSAFTWGAGAVNIIRGTFTMSGTARIAGNMATGLNSAGGVHVDGGSAQFIMNGGTIGGSRVADANEGRTVGGVRLSRGRTTMNGGFIQGNTNGGVRVQEYAGIIVTEFTMNGGTIDGNVSTGVNGAGVHLASGTFIMGGGTIRNNQQIGGTTANSGGGGVRVNGGTFTMNGVSARIENNTAGGTATSAGGGGVRHQGGTAIITAGTITNNHANNQGGGIFSNSPANLIVGSGAVITNNTPNDTNTNVLAQEHNMYDFED